MPAARCLLKINGSRRNAVNNMTIQIAEQRKKELTDKYVVVTAETPELKRFDGLTGTVKTVNMNGRALVQFDGPVDISWYDIDPDFLTIIDAPLPKKEKVTEAKKAAPAKKAPAGKAKGGKSPLELAREQATGGAKAKAAPASGDKKLSPLEMARSQGSTGSSSAKPAAAPSTKPAPAESGKKLSPLELARQQGAAGSSKSAPESDAPQQKATPQPTSDKKLSPLELARQQGAMGSRPSTSEEEAPAVEEATPAKSTTADDANLSPLELARKQGAPQG